ncbi:hypothetical protein E2C01_097758 [Portunus trituberculatus]|uniref:Uncharacterized protein n=1 Tax=Portunus trituberculatus TaxID=210409 RepID=A0A5B7K6K2_PORTR|nr:hypothetical protein [Portunus trituberculatus]
MTSSYFLFLTKGRTFMLMTKEGMFIRIFF